MSGFSSNLRHVEAPELCQCRRGIVATGGVCVRCWNDIQPSQTKIRGKFEIRSTERRKGSMICIDEHATAALPEDSLTPEKILDVLRGLPSKPEIIRSEHCVDAQGNPAAYEFKQEAVQLGYFSAAGEWVPDTHAHKVTIVAHPDIPL